MFIAIEGADGAGKATQAKILSEKLNAKLFSFPNYESITGKAILGNLKKEWASARYREYKNQLDERGGTIEEWASDSYINALVFQSLQLTNRMELVPEMLDAQAKGYIVADRFTTSARVYGALSGLDPDWLRETNAQLPVQPDLQIFLDIPIEVSFKRRPERRDAYESNREFLERVRIGYLELFAAEQTEHARTGQGARYVVVDGMGTVEEVAARIAAVVDDADYPAKAKAARQALAAGEAEYLAWCNAKRSPEELDAWILKLGDLRAQLQQAERDVNPKTRRTT